LLSHLEATSEHIESGGRRAVHAIHAGRSSGVGPLNPANPVYPAPGRQSFVNTYVPMRYPSASFAINSLFQDAAEIGDVGAFADPMSEEMDGVFRDGLVDVNRQLWGTSNGVIATCDTTNNSDTVTLLNPTLTQLNQLGRFEAADNGMVIDIGTVADPDT